MALREIAEKTVELDALNAALLQTYQRIPEIDEPEEDLAEMLTDGAGEGAQGQAEGAEAAAAAGEDVSASVDSIASELDAVFGIESKDDSKE